MLRIGVIGCGMVAGYGHLPAIRGSAEWELAAVADADRGRAEAAAAGTQAAVFVDARALVAAGALDAVVIATHADTHARVALDAFAHGLHVLCEKPMAASLAECGEMVAAASRAGRLLAVNFNARSSTVYRRIKAHIDAGDLGAIRVVRIVYNWSAHHWQPPERMEQFMRNGGPIVDSGVHFFDAARWFTGREFERIDASGVTLPPYDAPQHVIATCRLAGGAAALIEAGWLYCKHTSGDGHLYQIDVIGDEGAASHDTHTQTLRLFTRDRTESLSLKDEDKGFGYVYERFAESIRLGRVVDLASGEDGLKATEASLQALAAARR